MERENLYCAFLRGANINGRNMKMSDVCGVFLQAGMKNVSSVLATGNILFSSDIQKMELRSYLETAMSKYYLCDVTMFIKSMEEIKDILKDPPFAPDPELHLYTFICEHGFETVLMHEFINIIPTSKEAASIKSGFFYWQVSKGSTLDAGYSKILARKDMKEKFTSRNINTIRKIYDKLKS